MDFQEFTLNYLQIDEEKFGRIYTFIDFGNVNYWYEKQITFKKQKPRQ